MPAWAIRTPGLPRVCRAGRENAEIARELGYANNGTARKVVDRALRERTSERVDEYRETELARLDALQASYWDAAIEGDLPAATAVLKIMKHRPAYWAWIASRSRPRARGVWS